MRIVKSTCSRVFSTIFPTAYSSVFSKKFAVQRSAAQCSAIVAALLVAGLCSSVSWAATADRISGAMTTDSGLSQNGYSGEDDLNFTFTSAVSSYQVAQGSPVDATFTVAMNDGFVGPVTFVCSDPAPASMCTVPNPIGATGTVSFHVTTSLPTTASLQHSDRGMPMLYAAFVPGLLGILFTAGSRKRTQGRPRRRSPRGMHFLGLVIVLGFSTLWLASCGGGSGSSGNSSPGTMPGTYVITVTASSGATTLTQTFKLVVQ